ncbi:MAG: 3-oxoacyl-ACP synthase III family protein [Polyangia bacterium]
MADSIGVGILGFGSYLPATVRGNDFWPKDFRPDGERERQKNLLAIERSTEGKENQVVPEIAAAMAQLGDDPFRGARLRHVIGEEEDPSDMEAEACRRAMRAAGVRPDEIDLVMVSSLVQDRLYPTNGPAIQAKCELTNATAWSLELGCASFQPQLIAAAALIRTGVYRRVLLVESSAASRTIDYQSAISLQFGDGAAAVVVGEVPAGRGLIGQFTRTDGSLREGIVNAPIVDGQPARRWDRAAGLIRLSSFAPELGKRAGLRSTEFCREACLGALASAGLAVSDVKLFLANQSVGWLVDACRRSIGVPAEKTYETFREVANIGAAAIPYNLGRAHREGRLEEGDVVLMYSPGAGFTRGAIVYRWIAPSGVIM